jgi:hypothetical protein
VQGAAPYIVQHPINFRNNNTTHNVLMRNDSHKCSTKEKRAEREKTKSKRGREREKRQAKREKRRERVSFTILTNSFLRVKTLFLLLLLHFL